MYCIWRHLWSRCAFIGELTSYNDIYHFTKKRVNKAEATNDSAMMMDVGEDKSLFNLSSCAGYYIPIDDYKHYLSTYGLFNDFEEKILENIAVRDGEFKKDFNSGRYCPICLIEKPHKTRHVRKVNLCVREFQFYSHIFDKIVFYKNTKVYFLLCLLHVIYLYMELSSLISGFSEQFTFHPIFYFIEFFIIEVPIHLKLLTVLNIYIWGSWVLDLGLLLIATYYGLTIDELMNPQHYPYLFMHTQSGCEYHNPGNKGPLGNFKELLTR